LITKIKTNSLKVEVISIECDTLSLASTQAAAKRFLAQSDRLDALMCKAGVMSNLSDLSKDGYEIQFATSHLGHALLIKLILL
jgi:NAD(P)-dependent dehydrogenase (short-subunit alcohol dehydrogenase family)